MLTEWAEAAEVKGQYEQAAKWYSPPFTISIHALLDTSQMVRGCSFLTLRQPQAAVHVLCRRGTKDVLLSALRIAQRTGVPCAALADRCAALSTATETQPATPPQASDHSQPPMSPPFNNQQPAAPSSPAEDGEIVL